MRQLVSLLLALAATACSTTYDLKTKPPGAQVMAGSKVLGKTPLVFADSDVSDEQAGGILVRLMAEGFKPLWVWLPKDNHDYDLTINLNPFYMHAQREKLQRDFEIARPDLYRLSDSLLAAQNALLHGDEGAKAEDLRKLLEANPTLGSAHFLYALRLLREGKTEESLVALRDAMRFSPSEYDFLALYNEVKAAGGKGDNAPTP
jgi:tetratricopeptide (TPR) repeat protein